MKKGIKIVAIVLASIVALFVAVVGAACLLLDDEDLDYDPYY